MATLSKGYTFGATESVTNAKLHSLVDSATITNIRNADIADDALISFSKLAEQSIDGSKLVGLGNTLSSAGVIPKENLTSVAQKGANSDITSLTGLTTALSAAQGGTGSTAAANAASGVVVLNASSQLPAVSGALLTNLPVQTGYKVGSITRNVNANSGDVSYTSIGFQPKLVYFWFQYSGIKAESKGWDDGTTHICQAVKYSDTYVATEHATDIITTGSMKLFSTTEYQLGYILTMDADGFTIRWVKSGSPGSSVYTIYYRAYR